MTHGVGTQPDSSKSRMKAGLFGTTCSSGGRRCRRQALLLHGPRFWLGTCTSRRTGVTCALHRAPAAVSRPALVTPVRQSLLITRTSYATQRLNMSVGANHHEPRQQKVLCRRQGHLRSSYLQQRWASALEASLAVSRTPRLAWHLHGFVARCIEPPKLGAGRHNGHLCRQISLKQMSIVAWRPSSLPWKLMS